MATDTSPAALRPFGDADRSAVIGITERAFGQAWLDEAEWHESDAAWDDARFVRIRLVAERDGRVVGWGEIAHTPDHFHPRRYAAEVAVDPAFQRRGVGSVLLERLVRAAPGAARVRTFAQESAPRSVAFLERRGFAEVRRTWESRLDVAAFDAGRFAGAEDRVARQGIRIITFATLREADPDAARKAYDLYTACKRDVPSDDPPTPVPVEQFTRLLEGSTALPDAFFIAVDGDRWIGMSQMFLGQGGRLQQGITGVLAERRGRGIAMALKLRTVRYARERGAREIVTFNDSRNRRMLRINETLGFVRQPAWIWFDTSVA